VTNFMGDGAMIAFGVLEAQADDVPCAFDTAWALIEDLRGWIDQTSMSDQVRGVRVGGHFGPLLYRGSVTKRTSTSRLPAKPSMSQAD
jgi:adenylate cyclase